MGRSLILLLLIAAPAAAQDSPGWLLEDERNTIDVFGDNAESVVFIRNGGGEGSDPNRKMQRCDVPSCG